MIYILFDYLVYSKSYNFFIGVYVSGFFLHLRTWTLKSIYRFLCFFNFIFKIKPDMFLICFFKSSKQTKCMFWHDVISSSLSSCNKQKLYVYFFYIFCVLCIKTNNTQLYLNKYIYKILKCIYTTTFSIFLWKNIKNTCIQFYVNKLIS